MIIIKREKEQYIHTHVVRSLSALSFKLRGAHACRLFSPHIVSNACAIGNDTENAALLMTFVAS